MSNLYVTDQKDFHRRILIMATVIVDTSYVFSKNVDVWTNDFTTEPFTAGKRNFYKNRTHWVRAEVEGELMRRSNSAMLPIDMSAVPNLFTCKAMCLLYILSGSYKAILSRDKRHLKSRQFLHSNVQTFSSKTIERTLKDAVEDKSILPVVPDEKSRTKILYVTSNEYRKQWCITTIATAAVRTAWGLIDLAETQPNLPATRLQFWEEQLGHDRGIIDYAVSQLMVMRSTYSGERIE